MKKVHVIIFGLAVVFTFSPMVYAKNEFAATGNTAPTTRTGVVNQNQVKTQSMGEEQQLEVQTAERETSNAGTKSATPRSEEAVEHMSEVAKDVEEILTSKALKGGIGDQVRLIAQEQKESQDEIGKEIESVDKRKGLLKTVIGPDYKALKNLEKQVTKNELRVRQLTELMNKLTNKADKTMVQETIDALIQQNVSLQEVIAAENKVGSIFGWLARFFVK